MNIFRIEELVAVYTAPVPHRHNDSVPFFLSQNQALPYRRQKIDIKFELQLVYIEILLLPPLWRKSEKVAFLGTLNADLDGI